MLLCILSSGWCIIEWCGPDRNVDGERLSRGDNHLLKKSYGIHKSRCEFSTESIYGYYWQPDEEPRQATARWNRYITASQRSSPQSALYGVHHGSLLPSHRSLLWLRYVFDHHRRNSVRRRWAGKLFRLATVLQLCGRSCDNNRSSERLSTRRQTSVQALRSFKPYSSELASRKSGRKLQPTSSCRSPTSWRFSVLKTRSPTSQICRLTYPPLAKTTHL